MTSDAAVGVRKVSRGMHVLLYVLTALTFVVGTQLFVLAEHTEQFFSWTIGVPMSAAFVGGGFWGAAVVVFFASMLASRAYATWIAWREGRFATVQGVGGIPVEPRPVFEATDPA